MSGNRRERWLVRAAVTTAVALSQLLLVPVAGSAEPAVSLAHCGGNTTWNGTWGGQYSATYPTTASGTYDTACVLTEGDSGSGVSAMQAALKYCYPDDLPDGFAVDGGFGYKTQLAVRSVSLRERGLNSAEYSDRLRRVMDWPNWHYANGSYHYHCIDNG